MAQAIRFEQNFVFWFVVASKFSNQLNYIRCALSILYLHCHLMFEHTDAQWNELKLKTTKQHSSCLLYLIFYVDPSHLYIIYNTDTHDVFHIYLCKTVHIEHNVYSFQYIEWKMPSKQHLSIFAHRRYIVIQLERDRSLASANVNIFQNSERKNK